MIVTSETLGCESGGEEGIGVREGGQTYDCPSRMKDLRPFPRPVEVALPPRATVIAESTALLPPCERCIY